MVQCQSAPALGEREREAELIRVSFIRVNL